MKLLLYGVSHYTVPNADIHKYRIYDNQIEEKSLEIKQFSGVEEVLILSNETRTEFYFHVDETSFNHGDILRFIASYTNEDLENVIHETYRKFNEDVARHLLSILSRRDSENEKELNILQDVDDALSFAKRIGTAGTTLSSVFEEAISFALKVRSLPVMKSFYDSNLSHILRRIVSEWHTLNYKRFYLDGKSPLTMFLAKTLYHLGASSIVIGIQDEQSKKIFAKLIEWSEALPNDRGHKVFHQGNSHSKMYHLASADGIISEENAQKRDVSEESLEKMSKIRLTKKKQLWFSLFEKPEIKNQKINENGLKTISVREIDQQERQENIMDEDKGKAIKTYEESVNEEVSKIIKEYQTPLDAVLHTEKEPVFSTVPIKEFE